MLLMLGKAIGGVTLALGILYFGVSACVTVLGERLPESQTQAMHPRLQQYAPERLGNDPEHPVARILGIEECHTDNMAGDAPAFSFQVEVIIDGDTIQAHTSESAGQRLRLWGIDAPESDQPHGSEARARLASMIPTGKIVEARDMGTDQYGRILVIIGKNNELPVNWNMVLSGNAHHYAYGDSEDNKCLAEAQKTARAAQAGLWHEPNPVNPYDWRQQRNGRDSDSE